MGLFAKRMSLIDTENVFKVASLIKQIEDDGQKVIRLNIGEPDFNIPDFTKEELKRQIDANNTHYCDPQGLLSFRKAIAKEISTTRHIPVSPDQVVVFPGSKPPIAFCQHAYVDPGDEVIYPSPGFPIYESVVKYNNGVPVHLTMEEEKKFSFSGHDLEKLITKRTKLIYLNFPSNPTGGVATRKDLEEMAEVIKKRCSEDVRIYSDEIYEHILFDGSKHESIASIKGMNERTIIVSGHSKSYAWTGGRIGFAVFPTVEEALAFKNLNINYFSCVSPYAQEAAKVTLESPLRDETVQKMVRVFQERRDISLKALNDIPGISCLKPTATFYVFPNISGVVKNLGVIAAYESLPKDKQSKTYPATLFQKFLLFKYHVATLDRRAFGRIGSEGKHYLRISTTTATEDLKSGLRKISEAARDKKGFEQFFEEGKNIF